MLTMLITAYFTLVMAFVILIVLFIVLLRLCAAIKILEYFLKKLANFKNGGSQSVNNYAIYA